VLFHLVVNNVYGLKFLKRSPMNLTGGTGDKKFRG
jgi:hypothetical protein